MNRQLLKEKIRLVVQKMLNEDSQSSQQAKKLGLEYMGFGRYGKNGTVTHTVDNNKLIPVSKTKDKRGTDVQVQMHTTNDIKTGKKQSSAAEWPEFTWKNGKIYYSDGNPVVDKVFKNTKEASDWLVNNKVGGFIKEASTSAGAGPYQTPYAFATNNERRNKISQTSGYKLAGSRADKDDDLRANTTLKESKKKVIESGIGAPLSHFGSNDAKRLYTKILDYLIMTDDPQYQRIKGFRRAIVQLKDPLDRNKMIDIFNKEFRIGSSTAWEYYK